MERRKGGKRVSKKAQRRMLLLDFSEANFEQWAEFHWDKEAVTQFLRSE